MARRRYRCIWGGTTYSPIDRPEPAPDPDYDDPRYAPDGGHPDQEYDIGIDWLTASFGQREIISTQTIVLRLSDLPQLPISYPDTVQDD